MNLVVMFYKSDIDNFAIYAIAIILASLLEISMLLGDILEQLKKGK